LRDHAQVVIIGSGVTGLSTAYSLVNKGLNDIIILEKGYLASGASTRNGGGVRAQFTTEENILLAKWSIQRFRQLGLELKVNYWFRQGGYLFVAESEQELVALRDAAEFQRKFGLGTKVIDCSRVQEIVPCMDCSGIIGGSYRRGDGILFPFPLLNGYADFLRSRGVEIETHCEVSRIEPANGEFLLQTTRGELRAEKLVNAAGGWSSELGRMMQASIPTHPVRHQIMAGEPLAPFLKPMVVTLRDGFYMSQGPRGELVGGMTDSEPRGNDPAKSSAAFCEQFSSRLISLFPMLANARMMRQWAGFYDMSPDGNPILDRMPGIEEAFVACGSSGHGFMVSPAVGEFMSCLVTGKKPPFPTEPYSMSRFGKGTTKSESLVIG
jgi:sarcosine oxidase subunit beta